MSSQALKAAATAGTTQEGQQAAREARDPFEAFKRQLEQPGAKAQFMPMLGNSVANVDKFIRVVLNAVASNPDLLNVDRRSLMLACLKAAQDGLLPDGREAVLNIYNTKVKLPDGKERWEPRAQYLPMVAGLIKILYENPDVTYVDACCVYNGDFFEYERGDEPKIIHKPQGEGGFDEIKAVYFIAKIKREGGAIETKREVMFRRDIERVRAASKSADFGPWKTWFDQMAIKSVIKRGAKLMPRPDKWAQIEASDNLASGYSATGGAIGEAISQRANESAAGMQAAAEAKAQGAGPALEHHEPETLEGLNANQIQQRTDADLQHAERVTGELTGRGEVIDAGTGEIQGAGQARAQAPAPEQKRRRAKADAEDAKPAQPQQGSIDAPLEQTYAQLADAIAKADSEEGAWLVVDGSRHLPQDQQAELADLVRGKYGA